MRRVILPLLLLAAAPAAAETLARLPRQVLIDPRGAERVLVRFPVNTTWAREEMIERPAWRLPAGPGQAATYVLGDGLPLPGARTLFLGEVDLVNEARQRLMAGPDAGKDEFQRMRENACGHPRDPDVALATWLAATGHRELATMLAERTPDRERGEEKPATPAQALRRTLAWTAYARLVHGYMVRDDGPALFAGKWLLARYPEEAREYGQAGALVQEIERRTHRHLFATAGAGAPSTLASMEQRRRISWLIDALDEVDARQWGQPGGVDLAGDWRVTALIAEGEAAVPALLDTLENDRRLTRSVHFWRDFSRYRGVLEVREAALTALMSILRVQAFEPVATGDSFTGAGEARARETVRKLRAYWKSFGTMSFEDRMMRVLTDPGAKSEARQEAARNLARAGEQRTLGTMVWTSRVQAPGKKPNPNVDRFKDPTVGEAILAALAMDLVDPRPEYARREKREEDSMLAYYRDAVLDSYLGSLVALGDRRVAKAVVRAVASAPDVGARRRWARAAFDLGEAGPLEQLARDLVEGKLALPGLDVPEPVYDPDRTGAVRDLIWILTGTTPAIHGMLFRLAERKHPYRARLARRLYCAENGFEDARWFAHPYVIPLLRTALDDVTTTTRKWTLEGGKVILRYDGVTDDREIPQILRDPSKRVEAAAERVCDRAAVKLLEIISDDADYHALRKDREGRLAALRTRIDRHAGRWRLIRPGDPGWAERFEHEPRFVPEEGGGRR